jgi:hypothetical protein
MKIVEKLLLKYHRLREKIKKLGDEAEFRAEEKKKKYYLENYGAYHNANDLSREEMLEVFWRVLKNDDYDVSNFNGNTSISEPAKQDGGWNDLDGAGFIAEIERIFDFTNYDITGEKYLQIKTFGELADLVIKKAKKKLKQQDQ